MNQRLSWFGLAVLLAMSSGCGDEPTAKRAEMPTAEGGAGDANGDGVTFCAALDVLRDKCQRCHQDPPLNNAPVPFLTYEDTQAEYFDTGLLWWEVMQGAVEREFMPPLSLNSGANPIMPPIEALTEQQKATLLGWFEQGARPTGGTSCP